MSRRLRATRLAAVERKRSDVYLEDGDEDWDGDEPAEDKRIPVGPLDVSPEDAPQQPYAPGSAWPFAGARQP